MRRSGLIFAAILAAAVFLRFYDMESTGVYGADDAQTLMDARAKYEELRVIGGLFAGTWQELRGGPEFLLPEYLAQAHARLTRYQPVLPESLMSYLGALAMVAWGFTPWVGNLIEAFFGVGCVAVLYAYARQLTSRRVALLAAGMLAVSCFHVYCSRNTGGQTLPLFWWLLAFHVHTRWGRRVWRKPWRARRKQGRLLASGILAGLAVVSSWQIIPALPALFVAHALVCQRQRTRSRRVAETLRGSLVIACGMLAPVLAFEAAHYPMLLLFRSADLLYPHTTFIEAIAHRVASHAPCAWHPTGLVIFPYVVGVCEGWVTLGALAALLAAGMACIGTQLRANAALRRRPGIRLPALYLGSAIVVPGVLYSVMTGGAAGVYGFAWPFLLMLIAMGAVALWRGARTEPLAALADCGGAARGRGLLAEPLGPGGLAPVGLSRSARLAARSGRIHDLEFQAGPRLVVPHLRRHGPAPGCPPPLVRDGLAGTVRRPVSGGRPLRHGGCGTRRRVRAPVRPDVSGARGHAAQIRGPHPRADRGA